ncbi:MAG: hypothetical protein DMG70_17130 [Acidobacteria bacterium]|nr:MAG: hypothetical protein DMG70_17130 [Acidobacteriota bacterium]
MSVAVSLGKVPPFQSRSQDAYPARPARSIPTFIRITEGKTHDVNILDQFIPETGSFYVMDRGCLDFERLYRFTLCSAFFVVRIKENVLLQRRYSHSVDKSTGVRSDHTVILNAIESAKVYPETLRRVPYFDVENQRRLKFLTNNFFLPALTIARIYKSRWMVEILFRFIKQNLRTRFLLSSAIGSGKPSSALPSCCRGGLLLRRCHNEAHVCSRPRRASPKMASRSRSR